SRHRTTSSLPWRVNVYTLSPASTGDATPSPTLTFHCCLSAVGHACGALKPVTLLSRVGPRNWGQSSAPALREQSPIAVPRSHHRVPIAHLLETATRHPGRAGRRGWPGCSSRRGRHHGEKLLR